MSKSAVNINVSVGEPIRRLLDDRLDAINEEKISQTLNNTVARYQRMIAECLPDISEDAWLTLMNVFVGTYPLSNSDIDCMHEGVAAFHGLSYTCDADGQIQLEVLPDEAEVSRVSVEEIFRLTLPQRIAAAELIERWLTRSDQSLRPRQLAAEMRETALSSVTVGV